ncbi:MAG: HMA2 domain-containing protein [Desulfurivibrionaceae bacterium]
MHSRFLGGLALLALILHKKSSTQPTLPSVKGVIETVHSLPGRLRLYVPSLKNDLTAADLLSTKMESIAAIRSIEVSTLTGSVLIHFDPAEVDPVVVFGATARILGIETELGAKPQPLLWREFKAAGDGINDSIYHASAGLMDLKTMVGLSLISTVGYGLLTQSLRFSTPGAVTLGWWTYQHMFSEKN